MTTDPRARQQLMPGVVIPPPLSAPPPPPPPSSGRRGGRIVAYVHRAPDGTETWFDPSEIWVVREGTE